VDSLDKDNKGKNKTFARVKSVRVHKRSVTRDATGVMRTLCERILEHETGEYICFVDFEKAFEPVNWIKKCWDFEKFANWWKGRRLLQDLYIRQEAVA